MQRDYKSETNWPSVFAERFPDLILKAKKNQPCPSCGGTDRFHLGQNWRKDGGHFCRHCGGGDGFTLIQKALSWSFNDALNVCGLSVDSNNQTKTKSTISEYLNSLPKAHDEHQYLVSRGIKTLEPILQSGENLIIPKHNFDKIIGYESITPYGNKQHSGLPGGWYQIQKGSGFVFVEGYATGISIARHRHPDKSIIVCFGITNIPAIVNNFRDKYPTETFFLCVDADYKHDHSKKLNTLKGCIIDSPDKGDWNDFYDRPKKTIPNKKKFKCIDYEIKKRKASKSTKYDHYIVLILVDENTGEYWRAFYSCRKTGHKRPDYPIASKSNLAKLYIKSGFTEPTRWNRGQSIAKQLVGLEFYAETEIKTKHKKFYQNAVNLTPVEQTNNVVRMCSNNVQSVVNLCSLKLSEPSTEKAYSSFRVPIPYTEKTIPVDNKDITKLPCSIDQNQTPNKFGGFDFQQASNESLDQYFDRVIEATW